MIEEHDRSIALAALDTLAGRTAAGDRAAFEELYRRTSAKLFGTCLRILADRHEAEEALQSTYLAVWRNAASFNPTRGTLMTWLITMARNRAIDRLRAARVVASVPIDEAGAMGDPAPIASELLDASDERRRLHECMGSLAVADAGFLHKAFFEGFTYAELATRSAIPLGTLKSRIRRALLKLRDCLE